MNRRRFLNGACGLGVSTLATGFAANVASSLYVAKARAGGASPVDQFIVIINMPGGWDTTLSCDAWTSPVRPAEADLFIEYRDDEVTRVAGLALGPAMAPLIPFAKEMSIVNGVFLNSSDNGHPASHLYVFSGDPLLKAPSVSIELNRSVRSGPYGVVVNESIPLGGRAETVTTIAELIAIQNLDNPINRMRAMLAAVQGESDLLTAARIIAGSDAEYQELVRLIQIEAATGEISEPGALRAAFLSGTSSVAHYSLNTGFDTHSDHVGNHLKQQTAGWEKVAALFTLFKATPFGSTGESLFDRTTFMISSEFSRTAALNASKGKDHNPLTNSVVLAGRGVKGGQTIGASKLVTLAESNIGLSYQIGLPFDFATQVASPPDSPSVTTFITPTSIIRTLAEISAVDWGAFQSVPKATPFLSALVK
jgi:hypothetical protein